MLAIIELDIENGPRPGTYAVRVARSPGGDRPSVVIAIDIDDLLDRRPVIESSILASAVRTRRVLSNEESEVRSVGLRLFESVFSGSIAETYRTSRALAAERGDELQVRLRTTAPELAVLPWETLFDPELGTYVCRRDPLVRVVPTSLVREPLAVAPPLQILAMVAAPVNLEPIDVAGERDRLEDALREQLDSGRVEIDWLTDVSWRGLHSALLSGRWHVLHFIGHGGYDDARDEGLLAFVGRDGRAEYVDASSLADLLDEADPTPRLVVLNSCRSAAAGASDLFSSVAAALVRDGIGAVVAMQFSISDGAAVEFSNGFYAALAHGRGIDAAARSGRIGILGLSRGTLEWVTPVLYLRGDESRLFEFTESAELLDAEGRRPQEQPERPPANRTSTDTARIDATATSDEAEGQVALLENPPTDPVQPVPDTAFESAPETPAETFVPEATDESTAPSASIRAEHTAAERVLAASPTSPSVAEQSPLFPVETGLSSRPSAPPRVIFRLLWAIAIGGAFAALVAVLLYVALDDSTSPPIALGFVWLIGGGIAGIAGAIAAGAAGPRRRVIGAILALAPYLVLIPMLGISASSPWPAVALSVIQVILISAARIVTRPARGPSGDGQDRRRSA